MPVERTPEATDADYAAQVWLAQPELFAAQQEGVRIVGLSSFEYYGSTKPEDRRATFTPPGAETLRRMRADMDSWLTLHHGSEERVTDLDVFEANGEWVFLIRRGDACKRVPTVENERVMMRHFRPARDVVVAYALERDELRLHVRSAREKRLLREVFGWRLFDDLRRFSVREPFTLEPLRRDGADALIAPTGGGIDRIVLTELEVHGEVDPDGKQIWKARDWFALAEAMRVPAVPTEGRLVRAAFDFYFTGQSRPRPVQIYAGNQLRMSRHCDAMAVHRWLTERGFRTNNGVNCGDAETRREEKQTLIP